MILSVFFELLKSDADHDATRYFDLLIILLTLTSNEFSLISSLEEKASKILGILSSGVLINSTKKFFFNFVTMDSLKLPINIIFLFPLKNFNPPFLRQILVMLQY